MNSASPIDRSPSAELASFVAKATFEDVPPEARDVIENVFVDTVGVILAGVTRDAGMVSAKMIQRESGGCGIARVLGSDLETTLSNAALVTGTAGHCLDFDDMARVAVSGHASVPIIAAIFAIAEDERVTGEQAIAGYATGFEVMYYLNEATSPVHYQQGWHPTGTLGTFGAAASASSVLGLSERRVRTALNVAASMPSGVRQNYGSMTKPLHAGQAARRGVTAALLADSGFTANEQAINGESGFLRTYNCEGGNPSEGLPNLGEEWGLIEHGITQKLYPCCGAALSSITAADELHREHGFSPDSIEEVTVTTSQLPKDALVYEDPETGSEAKFSMQYTVARALMGRAITIDSFESEAIQDPEVQAVMGKVVHEGSDDVPYRSHESVVTVDTANGSYSKTVTVPPGLPKNPLSAAELREKFQRCSRLAVGEDCSRRGYESLSALREQDALDKVLDLLTVDRQ